MLVLGEIVKIEEIESKITVYILTQRYSPLLAVNNPIGVIFAGMFMSLLNINGQQLTNLTAYNEYITDVIVAVIVYLSAFMLIIKMWISKKKTGPKPTPVAAVKSKEVQK